MSGSGTASGSTSGTVRLNDEQWAAAQAPIGEALAVLAAAGTGKTTTMTERVRFILEQGVPPEEVLVLTFSRRAAAEFEERLRQRMPGAEGATVTTFHSWSWQLLRQHWAEAGLARPPTILEAEEQKENVLRNCIVWDRLGSLQADLRSWLFLPPSALWPDIVAAVAERHGTTYRRCLRAALAAHAGLEQHNSLAYLTEADAAQRPFTKLPAQLQLLLVGELHAALRRQLHVTACSAEAEGDMHEQLAAASRQAPLYLKWLEGEKKRGRLPDADAYAALCAGAGLSRCADVAERQRQLMRVAAAYQQELLCQGLVTLADLPLLARRALAGGGRALGWAQARWRYVLCDEFQDTGSVMLDLLKLLLGQRRSVTVVGDDDQSIYAFLAASPQVFADFRRHFGGRMLCLQTNFRSTAAICAFGGAVLHGNRREVSKSMVPARTGDSRPTLVRHFHTAEQEAAALASEVQRLWREEGVPHSSVCVLFRCLRHQGTEPHAPLMAALRRLGIPFLVAGRPHAGEDRGVAALCSYLAASLEVDPAFEVLLGLELHGLGQDVRSVVSEQQTAARLAGRPPPSLLACAEQVCSQADAALSQAPDQVPATQLGQLVSQLNHDDLRELQRLVMLLRQARLALGRDPLPQALLGLLRNSGLLDWLRQHDAPSMAGPGSQQQAQQVQQEREGDGQAEELPQSVRCVLDRANQLMTEWQQQQQQASQPVHADAAGAWDSFDALDDDDDDAARRQVAGEELVRELLARLATDTAADSLRQASQPPPQQQQQQQQQQQRHDGSRGDPGVLTISTIHGAKGLEWPVVLMPSVCEGLLPVKFHPPSALAAAAMQADDDSCSEAALEEQHRLHQEEERRLFHVAATRARDQLLVSYVQPPQAVPPEEPGGGLLDAPAHPTPPPPPQLGPADVPRCSTILACTVQRLRRQQPAVLQFEGRLPDLELAGPLGDSQGQLADMSNTLGSQPRQQRVSIAEQVRQKMAARQQAGKPVSLAGLGKKVKRKPLRLLNSCS